MMWQNGEEEPRGLLYWRRVLLAATPKGAIHATHLAMVDQGTEPEEVAVGDLRWFWKELAYSCFQFDLPKFLVVNTKSSRLDHMINMGPGYYVVCGCNSVP